MPRHPDRGRIERGALAIAAIMLVAVNLRPGAGSVGPVLEELRTGLDMGAGAAGILTGLPGLCFGLVGAVAVALSRRLGLAGGITAGIVAIAAGLLGRVVTDSVPVFLALSALALGGMAIGNVLVPAWVKAHGGTAVVTMMTVYSTLLLAGGTIAPLVSSALVGGRGWRDALGLWGVAALFGMPLWIVLALRDRADRAGSAPMAPPSERIAHSRTAWAMTAIFGLQSMHAYIQMGWLPQIYRDAGLSAAAAGALLSLLAGVTMIGGLVMPVVTARARTLAPHFIVFGVLLVAGYLGVWLAPARLPWLWAILLGIAGFAFPTVIALIPARTRTPGVTAQLSGFVQPIGYLMAGAGPVLVGLIHQATGDWTLVLVLLLVSAIPFTWTGLRVSRPVFVEDELSENRKDVS